MMALTSNQFQGSFSTFPPVPSSRSRGSKLQHFLPGFHPIRRKDRPISLKCASFSRIGTTPLLGPKIKVFRISAFKGSNEHDDSGGRTNGSKSLKSHVKVSCLQRESKNSSAESSEVQNVVASPYTAAEETSTRSLAFQNLFKNWLMLLHTPSETLPVEGATEKPASIEASENTMQKQERSVMLKRVWCYFLDMDATITIPFLLFGPLYLAVNLIYGLEVSKDLTPMWIFGPLIMALNIMLFRVVCSLYIFIFRRTVEVMKKIHVYSLLVYDYIFGGKLKEAIHAHIWQPLKNIDCNELARKKLKDFEGRMREKYLDYTESIWPLYCRTLRVLKRAKLI